MADKQARYVVEVVDRASQTLDKIKSKLDAIDKRLTSFGGRGFNRASNNFRNQVKRNTRAVDNFTLSTGRLRGSISTLGKTLAISGNLGFIGMVNSIGLATKSFITFEDRMAELKAVTGAQGEEFKKLEQTALKLADTSKFSATQTAEALVQLTRGGLSAGEAMQALQPAIQLATAGNTDLGQASDIVTNIMSGFKIGAEGLQRTVDQLAKASSLANTDIKQLGQAMSFAAGTSRAFGVPMERANAILLAFAKSGEKSGRAGRSLRRVLGKLADENIRGKLAELGVTVKDTSDVFGVIEQIEKLQLAPEKLSAALGNVELAQNFNALLGVGSEKLREFETEIRNSTGTAQSMADIMRNTLGGDLETLRSRLESFAIQLFEGFAPSLRSLVQGLIKFVDLLKRNAAVLKVIAKITIKVVRAYIVYKVTLAAVNFITRISIMLQKAWRFAMVLGRAATMGTAQAMRVLNLTMAASPWGIVIAGIAAAASLFLDFSSDIEDANDGLDEMSEKKKRFDDLNKSIEQRLAAVKELNKAQREALKTDIQQQIAEGEKEQARLKGIQAAGKLVDLQKETQAVTDSIVNKYGGSTYTMSPGTLAVMVDQAIAPMQLFSEGTTEELDNVNKALQKSRDQLKQLQAAGGVSTGLGGTGDDDTFAKETQRVTGTAPKVITINIDKLVENLDFNTTTVEEGLDGIKEKITQVLIDATRAAGISLT